MPVKDINCRESPLFHSYTCLVQYFQKRLGWNIWAVTDHLKEPKLNFPIRTGSMISVSFMFVLFCGGIEYIMNYFGVTYCTVEEHFNID